MRQIIIIFFFIISQYVAGQKKEPIWFNLEPKAGIATTWLLNKNISNDKNIKPVNLNVFPVFGAGLGIQFTPKICTQIDILKSDYGQNFNYENSVSDKNNVRINSTDLAFIVRATSEKMTYAGLGIKQSFVSKVSDGALGDVTERFNNFSSIVLDLGFILYHNNVFDLNLNIRLGYALTDAGKNESPLYYQPGQYLTAVYDSYKATNPASVQITFNFNWHIGYFATSQCKRKKGLVFFEY